VEIPTARNRIKPQPSTDGVTLGCVSASVVAVVVLVDQFADGIGSVWWPPVNAKVMAFAFASPAG
jgi:hypothetical protein